MEKKDIKSPVERLPNTGEMERILPAYQRKEIK
jgi:hypothetical protein